jgi:hypothetical protein
MSFKVSAPRLAAAATLLALLQGCANVTRLESTVPGTRLTMRDVAASELPRNEKLGSRSTGQYEFMAVTPQGGEFYGLLPLRVNGGTMAMSILFFAPALFIGGFRDVFPYYQIDPEGQVLRYKVKEQDEWRIYHPSTAESDRSKAYFDTLKLKGESKAGAAR